ncbi:MAG: single-stranded-DNA-specific exonuclease RecJ [Pseudomonadota bacterium]
MVPSAKIWKLRPSSPGASQLAHETGLTSLQAQLLINRGISDPADAESFLYPRLANMADPLVLKGMGDAVLAILKAIEEREVITVYGDYDADGLTATALLLNFFSDIGVAASAYIPSRLKEGYGLNEEAVRKIVNNGTGLIITVDCGISNVEEIVLARSLGTEVVVTDHHQVPKGFQAVFPVINPHQPGCAFPFKDLAGVGLSFFLAVSLRAALRERGWFDRRPAPDLKEYLDLVALGSVADRVPLRGQNRILVRGGIGMMTKSRWEGIKALKEIAGVVGKEITIDDLAFRLAPRLNAAGRMGDPETGLQLLTVEDPAMAEKLATELDEANTQRQRLERQIFNEIEELIRTSMEPVDSRTLVMAGEGWHRGVLGIVASRLVERYHRPSLVISIGDGLAVGSGRSIDSFNLYNALSQFGHLFERFGGHSHAAGFTLEADRVKMLKGELEALATKTLSHGDLIPTIYVDAEIPLTEITPQMVQQIRALAPFGEGNPEPTFLGRSLKALESRMVGEDHLRLKVRQEGRALEAIGFGLAGRHSLEGRTINMVFTPELNRWEGYDRIQLRIIDLELATD